LQQALAQFHSHRRLDGDGKPDLAVANYASNTVSVFRNTSSGVIGRRSFAGQRSLEQALSRFPVALGDLDGDGNLIWWWN